MLAVSLIVVMQMHPPPTDSPAWVKPEVRAALADVTAKLLHIRRNGRRTLGDDGKKDVEDVIAAFDKLLDAVGEKEAAKIAKSEHVWPAKLVAMALHRRKNPELHDELGKTYGDHTQRDNRSQKEWDRALLSRGGTSILERREIFQNHLADEYRLAWEFRLLVLPRLQEIPTSHGSRRESGFDTFNSFGIPCKHACYRVTAEGVYALGDERSIPTVLAVTKSQDEMILRDEETLDLFTCLARHQTGAGVRAVLDWAAWTEEFYVEYTSRPARGKLSDLKIVPRELLEGLAKAKGSDWSRLAEKLPEDGLTKRERELRAVMIAARTKAAPSDPTGDKK